MNIIFDHFLSFCKIEIVKLDNRWCMNAHNDYI